MNSSTEQKFIVQAKEFAKNAFIENPHYSFGHWSVMYDHSVMVKDFALKIAEHVECDKTLVAIGGLFHDIGKTYKADEETLHYDHEKFNLPVTEKFIDTLPLAEDEKNKLKSVVSYNDDSVEMKIVKDADALAFFADKRLYMLFLEWAVEKELTASIRRKLDKFEKLRFSASKEMGKDSFEIMKKDWDAYMTEHEFNFHIYMKKLLAYFFGGIMRLKTVILIMGILVAVYWIPFFIISFANRSNIVNSIDRLSVSDVIMIFGANITAQDEVTPLLKERLDAGKAIFDAGKGKKIVVSNTKVAAGVMQKYLQDTNVPTGFVEVDSQADKTTDSCMYEKKQHPEKRTIIFVSQGFHLPRLLYQCKKIGINGVAFPAESLRAPGRSNDSVLTVVAIRTSRYLREAGLTWLAILNIYR